MKLVPLLLLGIISGILSTIPIHFNLVPFSLYLPGTIFSCFTSIYLKRYISSLRIFYFIVFTTFVYFLSFFIFDPVVALLDFFQRAGIITAENQNYVYTYVPLVIVVFTFTLLFLFIFNFFIIHLTIKYFLILLLVGTLSYFISIFTYQGSGWLDIFDSYVFLVWPSVMAGLLGYYLQYVNKTRLNN